MKLRRAMHRTISISTITLIGPWRGATIGLRQVDIFATDWLRGGLHQGQHVFCCFEPCTDIMLYGGLHTLFSLSYYVEKTNILQAHGCDGEETALSP